MFELKPIDQHFAAFLASKDISIDEYKVGSLDTKATLVNSYEESKQHSGAARMASREDLLKALQAQAIYPTKVVIDNLIEYFSTQLPFVTPAGLVQLYHRAERIPNTSTRALVKSSYGGLTLDKIFPTTGGRAELLRAFRGAHPLLVKIPFDKTEELEAFAELGAYDPSATCILGPVARLEMLRAGGETVLAIEMPMCTCSVAAVPPPADMAMVDATALTLVTAVNFLHSKNRVHGDVKLSNILIRETGAQFLADLGSSVPIGAALITTTLSSLPRNSVVEELTATVELDWFQAGLCLVHLLGLRSAEDRLNKCEVLDLLCCIVNPSLNIQTIIQKLDIKHN